VSTPSVNQDIEPDPGIFYTFQDEFDGPAGSALNTAKWKYDLGGGGWGNNEMEVYTDSLNNSYLDGQSNLVIAATTDGAGHYWSARLNTNGIFAQQGGHFEARIKLAPQAGIWPAFWMLGANYSTAGWPQCGEVDIAELFGPAAFINSTVHTPNGTAVNSVGGTVPSGTAWHTYRLDWDLAAETFTFNLDGQPYYTISSVELPATSWIFGPATPSNGGMFFLLNVAVGGETSTPPATTMFPAVMLVDFVRAWK